MTDEQPPIAMNPSPVPMSFRVDHLDEGVRMVVVSHPMGVTTLFFDQAGAQELSRQLMSAPKPKLAKDLVLPKLVVPKG